ncbi:hypothetical protein [Spirochaeta thermophila]|uniref:Uncharacterized protein n=1 Tax=Winmispira thermophila (strain ATCC 49972 / DSM 6192 / RI 19.B1) TaxID=665571 RepID=E0RRK3_WINT6|nr:hypothetical protein [Spirochaeta thermophila]ADN01704.1 hypothetical protein STHERM_c07530 [Spirochaeta thermophila DSM 6192]
MLQFYALSVLTNFMSGIILAQETFSERTGITALFNPEVLRSKTFLLVWGILTAVTGVFKILSVTEGDVIIVGDLLPAIAGLASGIALLLMFYRERRTPSEGAEVGSDAVDRIDALLSQNKTLVGVLSVVAALLHFLFPRVLFL